MGECDKFIIVIVLTYKWGNLCLPFHAFLPRTNNINPNFATQQQQQQQQHGDSGKVKVFDDNFVYCKTTPNSVATSKEAPISEREMEIMKWQRVHKVCQHVYSKLHVLIFCPSLLFIITILLFWGLLLCSFTNCENFGSQKDPKALNRNPFPTAKVIQHILGLLCGHTNMQSVTEGGARSDKVLRKYNLSAARSSLSLIAGGLRALTRIFHTMKRINIFVEMLYNFNKVHKRPKDPTTESISCS